MKGDPGIIGPPGPQGPPGPFKGWSTLAGGMGNEWRS